VRAYATERGRLTVAMQNYTSGAVQPPEGVDDAWQGASFKGDGSAFWTCEHDHETEEDAEACGAAEFAFISEVVWTTNVDLTGSGG